MVYFAINYGFWDRIAKITRPNPLPRRAKISSSPGRLSPSNQAQLPLKVIIAFAKLNLGLHVLEKRADGYHNIETVFLRIGWHDELRFRPSNRLEMTCSDPELPVDERNLCIQAAKVVLGGVDLGVHIHLQKAIPFGAGLGGGSSDAAATLLVCNELWNRGLSSADLAALGAELGSDVPFFLGSAVALGRGRGEMLEALPVPNALIDRFLAVIVPNTKISTSEAYSEVHPTAESRIDLKELILEGELSDWRRHLVNDFESGILGGYSEIREVKEHLYASGASYASLSGSGSAVFGVFDSMDSAEAFCVGLPEDYRFWVGPAST